MPDLRTAWTGVRMIPGALDTVRSALINDVSYLVLPLIVILVVRFLTGDDGSVLPSPDVSYATIALFGMSVKETINRGLANRVFSPTNASYTTQFSILWLVLSAVVLAVLLLAVDGFVAIHRAEMIRAQASLFGLSLLLFIGLRVRFDRNDDLLYRIESAPVRIQDYFRGLYRIIHEATDRAELAAYSISQFKHVRQEESLFMRSDVWQRRALLLLDNNIRDLEVAVSELRVHREALEAQSQDPHRNDHIAPRSTSAGTCPVA